MILVFDIGTSAVKGALFTPEGILLGQQQRLVIEDTGNPEFPMVHEITPRKWLDSIISLTAQLIPENRHRIEAVTVSGNGPTLVPVDEAGAPLMPAMTWLDRRSGAESDMIFDKSGIRIDPSFYLPKALWIARNRPDIYGRCVAFMSCSEFVVQALCGERVMVLPGEGLEKYIWTEELIDAAGLERNKFPPFIQLGSAAGRVGATAAATYGLPAGIPVYAGGPDFAVSLLGTATVHPGRACDRAGTSEGINICTEHPIPDKRLMCYRHINRSYWNVTGIISTSGKALEWFRINIYRDRITYSELEEHAAAVPAGARKLLFLPYLSGERAPLWDPDARGVFMGLSLSHTIDDMARAVLESTGFAIRNVLRVMSDNNVHVDEMRVTGSPAKSDLWNRIKADITGKRILVPEISDSELVGDAILALVGKGRFASLEEASDSIVRIVKEFSPGDNASMYDELFGIYLESYEKLKSEFRTLAMVKDGR